MGSNKANRSIDFLRRNLYSCPKDVQKAAYKGLVRPVLEDGSSVLEQPPFCQHGKYAQQRLVKTATNVPFVRLLVTENDNTRQRIEITICLSKVWTGKAML